MSEVTPLLDRAVRGGREGTVSAVSEVTPLSGVQAGVGISNDALKLRRDYGLRCAGLLDLSQLAARALADGARPWCLAELCERVLRRRLRKCAELRTGSNWAAAQLTAEQLECAALPRDA